jgi:two-component system, cell cycle sensor histidine kinase and response regulator CckA
MPYALEVETLLEQPELAARLHAIFGDPADRIEEVAARATRIITERPVIVWEGDPQTFVFSYVSAAAERVLGYPAARWMQPGFWAKTVVHPDDASDAVAYCALATGQGRDHDFRYRARTADGETVLLHDVVHVIKGPLGVATKLRGIMVPVEEFEDE